MKPSADNALAPLEFILRVTIGLMALAALGWLSYFGLAGSSVLRDGDGVCVTAPVRAMTGASTGQRLKGVHALGSGNMLRSNAKATATSVELCDDTPSRQQHVWSLLSDAAPLGYTGGFVAFAWRLTLSARRRGLFSPHVALSTGRLGLYVLIGALIAGLVRAWADNHLMLSMAKTHYTTSWLFFFHYSWAVLFAGFGLLTVGRVMAQSVRMQREIDATV
jgi:uncharacterized membrane protein YraQ (UPF0718 family)